MSLDQTSTDYEHSSFISLLRNLGAEDVPHECTNLLTHCIGVANLLRNLGCGGRLVRAGLVHPVYGCDSSDALRLNLTHDELTELIGIEGEQLVYYYSLVSETSLYMAVRLWRSDLLERRVDGTTLRCSDINLRDLVVLFFVHSLEQDGRSRIDWTDEVLRRQQRLKDFRLMVAARLSESALERAMMVY